MVQAHIFTLAVPQCQDLFQFVFSQHAVPKFTRQARASPPHSSRGFPGPQWSSPFVNTYWPLRTDPLGNNRPICSSKDSNVPSQTWENPNPSQNKSFQSKAIARKKRGHQVSSSMSQITAITRIKSINPNYFPLEHPTFRTCFHSWFQTKLTREILAAHSQASPGLELKFLYCLSLSTQINQYRAFLHPLGPPITRPHLQAVTAAARGSLFTLSKLNSISLN